MSKVLHLCAKHSSLPEARGTVGFLCEFAPDSPWVRKAGDCYGPEILLGSADEALASVYPLVSKLLQNVPKIDGFPPLSLHEETLLEEFSYIARTLHLDRWITGQGFSKCHFVSYSPWLDRLRELRAVTGSSYEVVADLPLWESNWKGRAVKRLWSSRPTVAEFVRRVAPLWSRCLSGVPKRQRARSAPRGGIWFYSPAYTFTKIGLEYEPYLPEKLNYLVENPATGGKRLQELGRDWHLLYAWAQPPDIPSSSEVRALGEQVTAALSAVPLGERDSQLRDVFLNSEWWELFRKRSLPFVLFNVRSMQRWYQAVAPEMIVVGNAGDERALLAHENFHGVPVVMLQHGIMHWVYAVADQPVDVFLLRGSFFQRLLNENLRRKTVIRNFPEPKTTAEPAQAETQRDSILFITTPYEVPALYHEEDLRDIVRVLLRVANASGRRLIIRVHPYERISFYQQAVAELQRELGLSVEVSYSQGPGAEQVLARSRVAVLHFSTMFLDCLRHGIPIVSFAWHWFGNQRQFEDEEIFHFARDLKHFEALLRQGLEGSLPARQVGLEQFLAPTQPGEISEFFQEIWDSRKQSRERVLHPTA